LLERSEGGEARGNKIREVNFSGGEWLERAATGTKFRGKGYLKGFAYKRWGASHENRNLAGRGEFLKAEVGDRSPYW